MSKQPRQNNPVVVSLAAYDFLPARIGGQKGIALFNRYFSKHLRLICATTYSNRNELADYETVRLFKGGKLRYVNPFLYFRVKRLLKNYHATHLLLEHPYLGWLGWWIRYTTGIQLVIHSHNIEARRFKTLGKWWWPILEHYEKWTHRTADYNFFIHEDDRQYAITRFGLDPHKCFVMTYGIERSAAPDEVQRSGAASTVRKQFGIGDNEALLLFTGSFNYAPNLEALRVIREEIIPRLEHRGIEFKCLICGPWLQNPVAHPRIVYAGFVDDIDACFMASDVFINPVNDGGGIKTKLVEAIGLGTPAVSTVNGAMGISPELTGGQLSVVADTDWDGFAAAVAQSIHIRNTTPAEYYRHFYWGYSTEAAAAFISR